MLQYLVLAGAAVQTVGIANYIKEIIWGGVKPNKVTWLMWSVAPLIATFAAFSDGVRWSALPVFMSGFGPLLVFIASFLNPNAYWKLEKFDYLCGVCSVLALIFWWITKDPNIAIAFAIASDGFAAVPTIIKMWKYPETETVSPFTAGLFSALTSFAAIKMWGFSAYAFPIYLVMINILLISCFYRRKFMKYNTTDL